MLLTQPDVLHQQNNASAAITSMYTMFKNADWSRGNATNTYDVVKTAKFEHKCGQNQSALHLHSNMH